MKLKSKYRDIIMKRARRLTFTSMQQKINTLTHTHPSTTCSSASFTCCCIHKNWKSINDYGKHFSIKYYDNY